MATPNSIHNNGPIQLPKRPVPAPQLSTARQRADGTVEPEGTGRIRPDEVISPERWWASLELGSIGEAANRAVQPLKDLLPPCPAVADTVAQLIRNRSMPGHSDKDTAELWLLVQSPSLSLRDMG